MSMIVKGCVFIYKDKKNKEKEEAKGKKKTSTEVFEEVFKREKEKLSNG
jgi:hypothetical protein